MNLTNVSDLELQRLFGLVVVSIALGNFGGYLLRSVVEGFSRLLFHSALGRDVERREDMREETGRGGA